MLRTSLGVEDLGSRRLKGSKVVSTGCRGFNAAGCNFGFRRLRTQGFVKGLLGFGVSGGRDSGLSEFRF